MTRDTAWFAASAEMNAPGPFDRSVRRIGRRLFRVL